MVSHIAFGYWAEVLTSPIVDTETMALPSGALIDAEQKLNVRIS